jgi:transposase-like protein
MSIAWEDPDLARRMNSIRDTSTTRYQASQPRPRHQWDSAAARAMARHRWKTSNAATCPRCHLNQTQRYGHKRGKQRWWCQVCLKTFTERKEVTA